jgi:tetratricopeptide (TPR) repeat protein
VADSKGGGPAQSAVVVENAPPRAAHYRGRDAEVVRGLSLLGARRFLSVTGMAGIGKSAVALEIAERAVRDPEHEIDRAVWLRLTGMARGDAVLVQLANALGLATGGEASAHDVARRIGPARLLVVLDAPEELLARDRTGLRALLEALLWECPSLRLLVATRTLVGSLMMHEEQGLDLGPLAPDDAREAFLAIADGLLDDERDSPALGRLIDWLDGHPLAITLVARQASTASLERLERRLEDADGAQLAAALFDDPRQTPWERRMGERLASCLLLAFAGLAERAPEATEMVVWLARFPAGLPRALVSHLFGDKVEAHRASLVAHGLIEEHGPTARVALPASIRGVAAHHAATIRPERRAELVSESWGAVGGWLGALARRVGTPEERRAMGRGSREEANLDELLRAIDDAPMPIPGGDAARGLGERVASALAHFARLLSSPGVARAAEEIAREALARVHRLGAPAALASVLFTIGQLDERIGRLTEAEQAFDEALPIFRELGDRKSEAATRCALGALYARTDRAAEAEATYNDAIPLFRFLHDLQGEADALHDVGDLLAGLGQLEGAMKAYRGALPIHRGVLDVAGEASAQRALGECLVRAERWSDACAALQAAAQLHRAAGDQAGEARSLRAMGEALVRGDRLAEAEAAMADALALLHAIDHEAEVARTLAALADVHLARGEAARAWDRALDALAIHRRVQDSAGIAAAYALLSRAALARGRATRAVVLGAQAMRMQEALSDKLGQIHALQAIARALGALGREDAESATMLIAWVAAEAIHHPFAERMTIATGVTKPPPGPVLEARIALTAALSDCEGELLARGEDACAPIDEPEDGEVVRAG